jgi:O-acetylserine/cysteine efflux transporter
MMPLRDVLLALAVVVVWGINFVFIRWGVNEVPPLLLTALRYVVAAFPAVFFIKRPAVALSILIGYGIAVGVGQFGLLFTAIKFGMPAGLASVVIQLQVFFPSGLRCCSWASVRAARSCWGRWWRSPASGSSPPSGWAGRRCGPS